MELRYLRYFTAVAQWKGYREASRRLHLAQPAISRAVSDVEEELRAEAVLAGKTRGALTPEGEVLYAEAVRTLAQAELALNTAKRFSQLTPARWRDNNSHPASLCFTTFSSLLSGVQLHDDNSSGFS